MESGMRILAEGLEFPEGPVAMPDGSLVLVEIERETISRVAADGKVSVLARWAAARTVWRWGRKAPSTSATTEAFSFVPLPG